MRLPNHLKLLVILSSILAIGIVSNKISKSFSDQIDQKHMDGPANPGWQEDWNRMKIEPGVEIPENLQLKWYKELQNSSRSASNLEDVQEIGPDSVAGRIRAFQIDLANPDRFLVGAISGGLWESLDQGISWNNLTQAEQFVNITSLTQSPFDHNIFYFTTGEPRGNSAGIFGQGIFKSTDGGYSFNLIPGTEVTNFNATWRIRHSLTDSNTVFVASEDGLFVSRDGGTFFDPLLFGRANDIEIRKNGEMFVGMSGEGVYYSPDGEDNFTEISVGLPYSFSRVELAITAADSAFLIAALEDTENGQLLDLYASSDNGQNWIVMPNPAQAVNITSNFAWYCHSLFIHPQNSDFIIYSASRGAYSTDGGASWSRLLGVHADVHSFTMNPQDENQVFVTSDGGVNRFELDGGGDLTNVTKHNEGLNITQFYTGAVFPNGDVLGGTQDNGTWFGDRESKNFRKVSGADGAGCAVNLEDPSEIYVSYQRAYIFRVNNFGEMNVSYNHISSDILYSDDDQYFIAPVILNQDRPNELFVPTRQKMWYSSNKGDFWQPFTLLDESLFSMAFAEHEEKRAAFIVGASATLLRIDDIDSHFAGDETDLSFSAPNSITDGFIRHVEMHPDGDALYVALSSFNSADRVWKITDIWSEAPVWESISSSLPVFLPVNTIAINPNDPSNMAIGTDFGLFTTINEGEIWDLEESIPRTVIFQLELQDTLLSIFTHGRGIFQAELRELFTSVEEPVVESQFQVSPNPASSIINVNSDVDLTNKIFLLRGMDGGIVMEKQAQESIDISQISSGVYIVQLVGGKEMVSQKLIIQR